MCKSVYRGRKQTNERKQQQQQWKNILIKKSASLNDEWDLNVEFWWIYISCMRVLVCPAWERKRDGTRAFRTFSKRLTTTTTATTAAATTVVAVAVAAAAHNIRWKFNYTRAFNMCVCTCSYFGLFLLLRFFLFFLSFKKSKSQKWSANLRLFQYNSVKFCFRNDLCELFCSTMLNVKTKR